MTKKQIKAIKEWKARNSTRPQFSEEMEMSLKFGAGANIEETFFTLDDDKWAVVVNGDYWLETFRTKKEAETLAVAFRARAREGKRNGITK